MNTSNSPKDTTRVPGHVTRRITTQTTTRSLSILVADDDPWMSELLKRHLRMLTHRVAGAARDGQEAVALAKQLHPDLVILDINMPVIDGIQAARAIQADQNVSIIISTGAADESTLDRLRELKIGAYLVKPFSPAQLKAAIYVATYWHQEPSAHLLKSTG